MTVQLLQMMRVSNYRVFLSEEASILYAWRLALAVTMPDGHHPSDTVTRYRSVWVPTPLLDI
jgi:hypothetical protein